MRQIAWICLTCLLLSGCIMARKESKPFSLDGAWTLSQMEFPAGGTQSFPQDGHTFLRIYTGDTAMVQCRLTRTPSAYVIQPMGRCGVTLIDKGGGERLYLEDDDPRPLTVKNDTTIVIQRNGILHTWHRADHIAEEWGEEICSLVEEDLDGAGHYVLSAKEREQESRIHWLCFAIALILIVFLQVYLTVRRDRQRLYRQLCQIREEYEKRPQPVRKAIMAVEDEFFASEAYQTLQRRISTGLRLKDDEWVNVEEQVGLVYPGFGSQLRNLCMMSELEYRVCLLVKLRIAPTVIASVLSRDVSTISTVRSRLYKKVFGQKGGAKEWDDFIRSIGA